jgi:hypothetical protein
MQISKKLIVLYTNIFNRKKKRVQSRNTISRLLGNSSGVTTLVGATSDRRILVHIQAHRTRRVRMTDTVENSANIMGDRQFPGSMDHVCNTY